MIRTGKLQNGIGIVTDRMDQVSSVSIGIWVRTGSVDEVPEHAGISHFVEHMMFKGTGKRTAADIARDIDRLGAQINAFTGKEATCYYVRSVSSNFRKAADVICDMLEDSLFDTVEMNRERKVIEEEIKMTIDTPDELCHETFVEKVFAGDPLGKSIIGTPSSLANIDHGVMREYVDREYARSHIVISVAGCFDEKEIEDYFNSRLTGLGDRKEEKDYVKEAYEPSFSCTVKDIMQSHIMLGTRTISMEDDRLYALRILNNTVGGSMSSRLFQSIREEQGLAYSVYSMNSSYSDDGYFAIYAGIATDMMEKAISGIVEEIRKVERYGITGEELESSREQLKASFVFGEESTQNRMMANGKAFLLKGKVQEPEDIIEKYDNVTMDHIDSVKGLITGLKDYTCVAVSGEEFDLRETMEKII